jgi:hypothetical protein
MLAEQKATAGLAKGTRGQKLTRVTGTAIAEAPVSSIPTLASVGISHKLSSESQKLAAVPVRDFEQSVSSQRDKIQASAQRADRGCLGASGVWIAGIGSDHLVLPARRRATLRGMAKPDHRDRGYFPSPV